MKTENPIEEIWRIRDELAAQEGNDPRKMSEILRREEKKYGGRVKPLRKAAKGPAFLREGPAAYGRKSRNKS